MQDTDGVMSALPEAPIPLAGVAGFDRNQWQLSIGISGNLRLESVAGFDRNQWQSSRGIRTIDGFVRRWLRALLRKREKRPSFGGSRQDHQRWPNAFFAAHGLFTLHEASVQARQSR